MFQQMQAMAQKQVFKKKFIFSIYQCSLFSLLRIIADKIFIHIAFL